MTEERVYGMWQECEPSVVESLQPGAELPMCEAPYDATSDIPLDEQKCAQEDDVHLKILNF